MAECWPYLPLNEIDEGLSWLTEVDQRRDDESRWSFRAARQTFELRHELATAHYLRADQLLKQNVNGDWLVPVWTDATSLAVTAGADTLAVETEAEYVAGGSAIIWTACDDFELVTVSSVGPGSIVISPDAIAARPRALVMPLRAALIKDGARVSRSMRGFWEITIAFEAQDNPDVTLLVQPLEIMLSINTSSSMGDDSDAEGYSRLDVVKLNAISALDYLEATGAVHDVLVCLWGTGASTLRKDACDAAGYEALRAFVDAATASGASDYAQAMTGASAFFNGSGRRVQCVITCTAGTNAAAAVTIRDGIAGLEVYGVMMGDASPSALNTLDNTDRAAVVSDADFSTRAVVELAVLGLPSLDGIAFLDCGGSVLSAQSGQTIRATSYVDSGLGPIIPVQERTITEATRSTTLRKFTRAGRWALRQFLHFIRGRDRPFYVADFAIASLAMTSTTATIADGLLADAGDWVGRVINIGGKLREIEASELTIAGVVMTFASVGALPVNRAVRVLRRVRSYSDDVAIQHQRRAGWMTLSLDMGEI